MFNLFVMHKAMDIDCRWPGSVHDAKVFSNSAVNSKLKHTTMPQVYSHLIPGHIETPNYLIGDPAYPLTPHCMKEIQISKTNSEVIFNNILRRTRNPVECAFGRLKARWSILTRKTDLQLEAVPKVVHAWFVLHNLWATHQYRWPGNCANSNLKKYTKEDKHKNFPDPVYSNTTSEGELVRRTLIEHIKINLPDRY